MTSKRSIGVLGLDAMSGAIARRALESESLALLCGPGAAGFAAGVPVLEDVAALDTALPAPRALVVGLSALGRSVALGSPDFLDEALGRLGPGDLVLACLDLENDGLAALSRRCSERDLGLVDLGLSAEGLGAAVLTAGGGGRDWETARPCLDALGASALVGGLGAGSAAALARSSLEGIQIELLSEAYQLLRSGLRVSHDEMRTFFAEWNSGELADPLLAATAAALGLRDDDGEPLIEKVLDSAGAAGACSRTAGIAMALAIPAPMTAGAAGARALAALKDERVDASAILVGPKSAATGDRRALVEELGNALLAAFCLAADETFSFLWRLSDRRGLAIDSALAARLWAEASGSRVLGRAAEALARSGGRRHVLLDATFTTSLDQTMRHLRRLVSHAVQVGLPVPAFAAAAAYYDGIRSTWLPANLAVALEDSRRGSGYERIDRPRGERRHSDWR